MRYKSLEDRIVDIAAIVLVALVAVVCVYPIIYCISMSFSDNDAIIKSSVNLLPKGFNLDSYKLVLGNAQFWTALTNSVVYTVVGTVISVASNLTLGYVLSRKNFVLKKSLTVFILIPMFFSGGLIPSYMLIKSLKLYATIWALVLPGAVSIWNAILAKTFFQTTIPNEVVESAIIDGANDFQIFLRIVMPLSTTIIAILTLYAAVGMWNDYFNCMIYMPHSDQQSLQLFLRNVLAAQNELSQMLDATDFKNNFVNAQRIKYVLIVVSTMPIIVVYPFIQKYFVKGVMLGSIKG